MTREFKLSLDDFVEEISLKVIDEILLLESSYEKDDIFKFGELMPYIRGVDIAYGTVLKHSGIIRSEETDIPLIEFIKIIIEARKNQKIDSKDAWSQIKDIIKRASEFTKYYEEELKIDLDVLKENLTLKIIDGFQITENFKAPDISKFLIFDNLIDGIDTVYGSILISPDIEVEEEELLLLEIIDDIRDLYVEGRIGPEDAWRQIKDIITEIKSVK